MIKFVETEDRELANQLETDFLTDDLTKFVAAAYDMPEPIWDEIMSSELSPLERNRKVVMACFAVYTVEHTPAKVSNFEQLDAWMREFMMEQLQEFLACAVLRMFSPKSLRVGDPTLAEGNPSQYFH